MTEQKQQESPESRALATVDRSLTAYTEEFGKLLAGRVDPDIFVSVAYEAIRHSPDLLDVALKSPDSLMKALHDAAALGLVPNGVLGSAYIVPRKNKTTGRREAYFQAGYRGLVELTLRSGKVRHVESRIVYQADRFELTYGDSPRVIHVPMLDGDRGAIRGVYGVATMHDGSKVIEYMSDAQVQAIKKRAASQSGPWATDYEEMARKTVIRRLCKSLPMSVDVQRAIELDDAEYVDVTPVAEPTGSASLAGRIRSLTKQEDGEPERDEQRAEPEPAEEKGNVVSGSATVTAAGRAETPAAASATVEQSEDMPAETEPDSVDPDEPAGDRTTIADVEPDEPLTEWRGILQPQARGMKFEHTTKEGSTWKAKIAYADDRVKNAITSIPGDTPATIRGSIELVPWERNGESMPPYRRITVYVVTMAVQS